MQYTIFKITEKDNLMNDMLERDYQKIGRDIKSDNYKLNLFCKYDNDLKLSWKNIILEFGADNPPSRSGLSGIIICESDKNNYAITYGSSSFLVQKYSDKEFGFNFAKRIKLKELKRKSSIIPHSTRNTSITSFKNTSTILFDSGENITSLSFSPEDEFYGKRIDIGKSIKVNVDIQLDGISSLFNKIEEDINKKVINNIPLLIKVTNPDAIEMYNKIMYDNLSQYDPSKPLSSTQFTVNEFDIVGSSIYFEEEHTQIIKMGKIEEEIELHNLEDLFEFGQKYNLSIKDIIERGKIIYKDSSNNQLYSEYIRKFITYEIDKEKASLYNDEWYNYNDDYYELIMEEVKSIKVIYDKTDNVSKKEIEQYRKNEKEYREEILNKILSARHNGILKDRNLFISKYENDYFDSKYKIEIADIIINDEYISLKIGSSQSLSYCVDQSELSAHLIKAGKIDLKKEKLSEPQKYGVWFYLENNSIFEGDNAYIERINSIMLLSKLSTWSKNIKILGKIPVIHVNKYNSEA